jgi:dipeptidyl aminopeptidase/acylaminoacyl peptidase
VRWAQGAQLSSDGDLVAWCEVSLDLERDEPVSTVMVAPSSGDKEPRRFSEGPHDSAPAWGPGGRYLAYVSSDPGPPAVHLAPLDGGAPVKVETPGPVRWFNWSPTGDRLVLVVNVGGRATDTNKPTERNAPRVIRGTFNRLDGAGWLDGRDHLFVYDVSGHALRQISSGDYDHAQPSCSPDGSSIVFVSDRSRSRYDRVGRGDLWVVAATGGRARRLVGGIGWAAFPTFSPDGSRVAFSGLLGGEQQAARDGRLFVVRSDGLGDVEQLVPDLDRPVAFSLSAQPFAWLSDDELVFTFAEAGTVGIRRARLGERSGRVIVSGDAQVNGLSVGGPDHHRVLSYASAWVDSPSEILCLDLAKRSRSPLQVSCAGKELSQSVELLKTERLRTKSADGTDIEYFVIRPKAGRARPKSPAPPLFLEIHGGPNLYNPISELFPYYQVLAGAGYLVTLPNPRGSIGYGEQFTKQVRGDWAGKDFQDLMACADDVIERGMADKGRQFVGGYSYGGFMSAWTVGQTTRFLAAAVGAPVIDQASMFGTSDANSVLADDWKGDPWSCAAALASRSPVSFVRNVGTPVFLYVNDGDLRCPPGQADEFFIGLKWFGKEVEYVRYPGGSHFSIFPMVGAPSQTEDRLRRVLDFLGRHGGLLVKRP